ncbi:CpaD family pilus assembly lipoprotein [Azospirillum sp. SYSU D00513]|uniref:CpaD family pilus assembly lipoprotein n=1 Tax=Azospirillum sp. SYSU D00513 TaxID=2812561 RepID=UPI001A9626A0|nr:CpaD family pilus assembly lipoprotein [Azospirillum sp. SYSU D00513]
MTRSRSALFGSMLAVLVLSACGRSFPPLSEPPQITVAREPRYLQLTVDSSGAIGGAPGDLPGFLALWRDEGWGPLTVEAPSLPPRARGRLAAALAAKVRGVGADPEAIALAPPGTGTPGVWLRFDRAVAAIPECAPEMPSFGKIPNFPGPAFGCATRGNLGAMVANPADLLGPRPNGSRDATRGAAVVNRYRRGPSAGGAAQQGASSGGAAPAASRP